MSAEIGPADGVHRQKTVIFPFDQANKEVGEPHENVPVKGLAGEAVALVVDAGDVRIGVIKGLGVLSLKQLDALVGVRLLVADDHEPQVADLAAHLHGPGRNL